MNSIDRIRGPLGRRIWYKIERQVWGLVRREIRCDIWEQEEGQIWRQVVRQVGDELENWLQEGAL